MIILFIFVNIYKEICVYNINKNLHCKNLDSTFFMDYKKYRFVIHYKMKCMATT